MNIFEEKMVEILKDLAENHGAVGLKAEFEDEGTDFSEAMRLKELGLCSGLDITIKIGGCCAIKDIQDAKIIGAGTLVAPMIESPYAAKKYIEAYRSVLKSEEIDGMSFYINIETKNGCDNLDEILEVSSGDIDGIVIGRTDLTGSLGMSKDQVNSEIIYDYTSMVAGKVKQQNKEVIIGGAVSEMSVPFFRKISSDYMDKYETRKVIFNYSDDISDENIASGIMKAIQFEIMWLKNKSRCYNKIYDNDIRRIKSLENRYRNMNTYV